VRYHPATHACTYVEVVCAAAQRKAQFRGCGWAQPKCLRQGVGGHGELQHTSGIAGATAGVLESATAAETGVLPTGRSPASTGTPARTGGYRVHSRATHRRTHRHGIGSYTCTRAAYLPGGRRRAAALALRWPVGARRTRLERLLCSCRRRPHLRSQRPRRRWRQHWQTTSHPHWHRTSPRQ
jgi:hypothetical protein